MSNDNTGGPAFPMDFELFKEMIRQIEASDLSKNQKADLLKKIGQSACGMTLRDYFAAKAMPVHMAALSTWDAGSQESWHNEIARISYATADAMLKAREGK